MRPVRLLRSLIARSPPNGKKEWEREGGRSSAPSVFLAARLARLGAAALRPASGQLFGMKVFCA